MTIHLNFVLEVFSFSATTPAAAAAAQEHNIQQEQDIFRPYFYTACIAIVIQFHTLYYWVGYSKFHIATFMGICNQK